MEELVVTGDVIMVDVLIYAGMSYIIFGILNAFAIRKLGKDSLAYKAISIHKFIFLSAISLISIGLLIASLCGITMKATTETFLGVPYFAFWTYYMVSVLHRIISEKKR